MVSATRMTMQCLIVWLFCVSGLAPRAEVSGWEVRLADSTGIYKRLAAEEVRKFDEMSPALRLVSKILGTQLSKSASYLDRATDLGGEDIEIWFLRGLIQRYRGQAESAESLFKRVVAEDDRYEGFGFDNVWIQLGKVYRESERYDQAVDAFKQGALIDLDDTWPLIELFQVFLEMKKDVEASEAFYGGLTHINDPKKLDRLYTDCKAIATKDEIGRWEELQIPEDRLVFIKTFWRKRDPNTVDQVNQRLLEHYRRLKLVRERYSHPVKPWYDARGEIFVRLGPPDRIYVGRPGVNVKDNETWSYDHIKSGVTVDFVNMGSGYEVRSLLDAVSGSATYEELAGVFDERSHIHGNYATMAMKIRTQGDAVMSRAREDMRQAGSDIAQLFAAATGIDRALMTGQYLGTNEFRQDYLANEGFLGGQYYVFDTGAPHLPINCNFASFKGTDGQSRLEFYYTVPFGQLSFNPSITVVDKFETSLHVQMKLFDENFDEQATIDRTYPITANTNETTSHFFLDQLDSDLQPGRYRVGLELRNKETAKVGIYQFVVMVRDYRTDTLTVSDIEIAQYVDQTVVRDKYLKPHSTLKVVPNPAAALLRTKPLTVYYEIYNLSLNNEAKSLYQVSYSIRMIDTDESFLSSIAGVFSSKKDAATTSVTEKEGKGRNEREYIAFDISELPPGIARLEVRVKDLLSGRETASGINLTIVEPPKAEDDVKQN